MTSATIHASAVLTGAHAVLIRGPSGAGKSRLALDLIEAGRTGVLRFARLVGDDRVYVQAAGGRLLVRSAEVLAGLLEVRGLGILRLPYEPSAIVGLVVDLGVSLERLPQPGERRVNVEGISVPRFAVADGSRALPAVLTVLTSAAEALCEPDFASL
jgi:HPr kinase/phosphorylase